MKNLQVYINERRIGDIRQDMIFDIEVSSTQHSEERTTRHGSDEINRIEDEEIKDMVRRASSKIIDGITNDRINITKRAEGQDRFVVHDTYTETWIVGAIQDISETTMKVRIVTVYRGSDFRNNSNRTYTVEL